ncbi:MAG: gluconokinase [Gemmatimonadaceae bacterium]
MHTGLYVVMGVSGSGKTVIGTAFARALGVEFVEGDDYHPAENVRLMAAGTPLTDENRAGWLEALAARLRVASDSGSGLVMSCSALKRKYRDVLRRGAPAVRLVYLKGTQELIARRMTTRRGHFMPPALLASQFATLEEPAPDEGAWICDVTESPEEIVASLVKRAAE